jgi:hypothetical protein
MKPSLRSPFPTNEQELLLKACLLSGELMQTSYDSWKSLVNIETDVEHGSFRQLPLLYLNLNRHSNNDELMPRLKGIYRKSWSNNQILFFKLGQVLRLLHQKGIRTMVLKGVALSLLAYKNFAVRPMADMDIMVPVSQANHTIEWLKQNGWKSSVETNDEYYLNHSKSVTLINDENTELDLHWYPLDECFGIMNDDLFWDRAINMTVSGENTLALCPADELLLTIVHGLMPNVEPPIRWIADAYVLITASDLQIDWERLVDYAKKLSVIIQLKDGLKYLKENFSAPVPEDVYKQIQLIKPSIADRILYNQGKRRGVYVYHPSFEKLLSVYADYLKTTTRKGLISQHIGYLKFMRQRTKGKNYFRILVYYLSVLLKTNRNKTSREQKK